MSLIMCALLIDPRMPKAGFAFSVVASVDVSLAFNAAAEVVIWMAFALE
jgi:hypothetical protein